MDDWGTGGGNGWLWNSRKGGWLGKWMVVNWKEMVDGWGK